MGAQIEIKITCLIALGLALVVAVTPACRKPPGGEEKADEEPATSQTTKKQTPGAVPKKLESTWVEYTLMDDETVIQTPRNWMSVRSEEDVEDQIGWLSSDYGKGHIHRVYRMSREDLGEKAVVDFAETMLAILTDGDKVLSETEWLSGDSHGGATSRKISQLTTDIEGEEGEMKDAWLVFESKDFGEFFYIQTSYYPSPLPEAGLKEITSVMDTLRPGQKSAGPAEAPKKKEDNETGIPEEKRE